MFLPIDVVVEGVTTLVTFVGHSQPRFFPERHGPVTVAAAAIRADADRHGGKGFINSMADSEKIANRALDAGMPLVIPVDSQCHQTGIERSAMGNGAPDMHDLTRAIEVSQRYGSAWFN